MESMEAQFTFRKVPGRWFLPLGLMMVLGPAAAPAQMHHVDAPERVTRALGVYEWIGELNKPTAARFVPVSLYINGTMQDAGLYLARPVPFALQTGDIYALEHAGEPQGLLDLDYASRVVTNQAVKDDDPEGAWYGYGKFTASVPAKVAALHPSAHVPVIQSDEKPATTADNGRPHMSRRGDATAPASTAPASPGGGDEKGTAAKPDAGDAAKTGGTGGGSATEAADDTDRPTLRHRDPSQDAARRREYGNGSKQASVTAVVPGPGDDPDRPVLGRNTEADAMTPPLTGLPADMHQAVGVSDPAHRDQHDFAREWDTPSERSLTLASLEGVARTRVTAYLAANRLVPSSAPLPRESASPVANPAGAAASAPAAVSAPAPAAAEHGDGADGEGAPPKLQRGVPGQYEASGTPHTVAKAAPITAAPPVPPAPLAKTTARRTPPVSGHTETRRTPRAGASSAATLALVRSSLAGYTLSYGGLPTFVYTAAASVASLEAAAMKPTKPTPTPGEIPHAPASGTAHPAVFVTVVAQRLPSGELQVALSSVTDSLHQDRSPRLRLIDAVDPDDSHRASLLFELRGATSRQFALYRLTAAQAEQTFTTASIE